MLPISKKRDREAGRKIRIAEVLLTDESSHSQWIQGQNETQCFSFFATEQMVISNT